MCSGETSTSTHVLREWKRIVEKTAIELYEALDDAKSLGEMFAEVGLGHGRTPSQRAKVLSMICGDVEETSVDDLKFRLRVFLRSTCKAYFRQGISEVVDSSECDLARVQQTNKNGKRLLPTTCKKNECACRQDAALEADIERARLAAAALAEKSVRPADAKTGKRALEILNNKAPVDRKGVNCYGGTLGGDISIALDCPEDSILLTTDQSFDLICAELGISFERFTP